jgi:hypothetical protein
MPVGFLTQEQRDGFGRYVRSPSREELERYPILDADVARLSPLGWEHINMLGRYSFAVPDDVARGELRPLRNPSDDL